LGGFEDAAVRAERLLPRAKTNDPTKAVVYIERTKNGFYYHSNFITAGSDYPTKVGSDAVTDGAFAFVNIVHAERPSDVDWKRTEQIFRDNVEILLDESVFDSKGVPLVDLSGAKRVKLVNGAAGKVIADTGVETLDRNRPPPLVLQRVLGCCFYGIPPHLASSFPRELSARNFEPKNVEFISLVKDSATEVAIDRATLVKERRVGGDQPITTLPAVEKMFQQAKGKTVVLLGHVEGGHFVIRNAKNESVGSLPIAAVREAARKNDVELIDLGCNTAREVNKESLGLGVATRFNSVDAVNAFNRALGRSRNYADFFENLTSQGLKVVVDGQFVRGSSLRAEVYSPQKAKPRPLWIKIAEVFVTFRGKS
jgi:hypothetical protein